MNPEKEKLPTLDDDQQEFANKEWNKAQERTHFCQLEPQDAFEYGLFLGIKYAYGEIE